MFTAFLAARPARAADVGWCGTPQELSALMKAEGQRSLAYGNQHILFEKLPGGKIRKADKYVGLLFSADPKGQVGYMIQADKPMGTPATKSCIADRMQDVKLYDARIPGIPPETLVNSTVSAAARRCAAEGRRGIIAEESCRFHNESLNNAAKVGEGVVLQARGTTRKADGSWQFDSSMITVTLIMPGNGTDPDGKRSPSRDGRGVLALTALPEGATIIGRVFTGGAYTAQAMEMLEARKNGKKVSALLQPR